MAMPTTDEKLAAKKTSSWIKAIWTGKSNNSTANARSFSRLRKLTIITIVSVAGTTTSLISTVYYPALVQMQEYFQTTDTAINASVAIYVFLIGFSPVIWSSFSDVYGRRPIYLISFMIAIVGSVCCAVSVNIAMFIAFRAVAALGSSSCLSLGAATIGDIFESHQRGRAFSYYMTGPLLGPALGPIIGGGLNQALGWRSIFWFVTILNSCVWLATLLFLPETRYTLKSEASASMTPPATAETDNTTEKANDQPKKRKIINPLESLGLLRNLNIALSAWFIGILFMVYYLMNVNFTRVYTVQYGFNSSLVGLFYLPCAIGNVLGGWIGGQASDRLYMKRAKNHTGPAYPEMRLGGLFFYGSITMQLLGFAAYGWCVQYNIHFSAGLVFLFFVGLALGAQNITTSTYMVDCFRDRSASVTACNNFMRYTMSGISSLVAADLGRVLMPGILYTLCGAVLFLFGGCIVYIQTKGAKKAKQRQQEELVQ
ncbi:major facilitator superfamily domain-containing protein [Phascolomyces articulosus]|uniref:Major facilitator superfamily domain-containing protein n=1 Tax=Phascolomyces articulosus TaxID=60185 RepID=A0AAD5KD87_9FUNG|nr:major facilitator superfamily domain-containing protein [Phascolomyces articulosus]